MRIYCTGCIRSLGIITTCCKFIPLNNVCPIPYSPFPGYHHFHLWFYKFVFGHFFFFSKKILFTFRERGREGQRGRETSKCERNTDWLSLTCPPPTRDLAHNPGTCPDRESNQQPFGSQADTQSTEPHQPELFFLNF